MDGVDWPRTAAFAGVLVLISAVVLAYALARWTVDGDTDPYQSRPRPRPDDQGREDWRSSR